MEDEPEKVSELTLEQELFQKEKRGNVEFSAEEIAQSLSEYLDPVEFLEYIHEETAEYSPDVIQDFILDHAVTSLASMGFDPEEILSIIGLLEI
jgi:hypothetical protein